jgi:hypothetical protein
MFRAMFIAILVIALGFCVAPLLTAHEEPTPPPEESTWVWPWQETPRPTASLVHEFGVERDTRGRVQLRYQKR